MSDDEKAPSSTPQGTVSGAEQEGVSTSADRPSETIKLRSIIDEVAAETGMAVGDVLKAVNATHAKMLSSFDRVGKVRLGENGTLRRKQRSGDRTVIAWMHPESE